MRRTLIRHSLGKSENHETIARFSLLPRFKVESVRSLSQLDAFARCSLVANDEKFENLL